MAGRKRRMKLTPGSEGAMGVRELHEQDMQRLVTKANQNVAKKLSARRPRGGGGGTMVDPLGKAIKPRGLPRVRNCCT